MLPLSKPSSPDPTKRLKSNEFDRKNSFNSLFQSSISFQKSRQWLLISILSFQIILFLMLRSVPVSFTTRHVAHQPSTSDISDSILLLPEQSQEEQPKSDISGSISYLSKQPQEEEQLKSENKGSISLLPEQPLEEQRKSDISGSISSLSKQPQEEEQLKSENSGSVSLLPKQPQDEQRKSDISGSISLLPESRKQSNSVISGSISLIPDQCSSGRIYVYDVPKIFNEELLKNCRELNLWVSRCDMLMNDGFGRSATDLKGVVPDNLIPAWYWTDQFVSEIIFHNRILNHKCRTLDPESATGFFIPFYVGLAVGKYLWTNSSAKERDWHCEMMLKWVRDQPYWNRSNGWDHFFTMGRISWDFRRSKDEDWGSGCIYMPGMRNITRLLIERNPWDYFDVGIPYPTGFHPRSDSDILQWQDYVRNRNRSTLYCFAGATRATIKNDFRGLLQSKCKEEFGACKVVNCAGSRCSNGTSAILKTFLDSEFCLQPRGDSFTRRSIFDCMVAGSIPVLFWKRSAYYQYQWFLPGEPESYSVFIDRHAVKNGTTSIRSVLESYSKEQIKKMRENVISHIPKFVYAKPRNGLETIKDAFDVAVDGVLRRFKEQEQWGYKW